MLVGEDPAHIDRLWQRMYVASMGHGVLGTVGGAMAAIRWRLGHQGEALGGPSGTCSAAGFATASGCMAMPGRRRARKLMGLGIEGVIRLHGCGRHRPVAAIRDAVGPGRLMVDAHGPSWMTPADAIRVGRALEPLDLLFYEDPIAPDNLDGYARIRDAVAIPLAAGERQANIWGLRPLIERELVDVVQPDTGRAGGITQMRKIAAMAEAHYITMAPHSGSLGPVAEFAALHVMATIPNALMLERVEFDWPGRAEVVTPALRTEDGHLRVPDAPGLGVDLVLDEITKYPSVRNVATMPEDDGWAYEPGTVAENIYFQTRLARARKLRRRAS